MEEVEREKQEDIKQEVEEERVEEKQEVQEVELPVRVLDLLASFVDSSINTLYYSNKIPYIKLLEDGSYWEFEGNCIRLVTWKDEYSICDEINIVVYEQREKVHEFDTSPKTLLSVVFKSWRGQRKIRLFEVYRKMLFFEHPDNIEFLSNK